jgi:hypothetical protein
MSLDITAFIDAGGKILSIHQRQSILDELKRFAGKKCRIRIHPSTRTLEQNAYLHAVFTRIASFMYDAGMRCPGDDKFSAEDWKVYFKKKHGLTKVLTLPDGSTETVLVSTAKYNKKEMTQFIEQIRHDDFIIHSGHYILTPEEFKKGKHYD